MDTMDDSLARRVMHLTWHGLAADGAEHGNPHARRFTSPAAWQRARQAIVDACHEASASESLREYFSTRWLDQFAPRLS
jgi:hypothetical protein